MDGTGLLIIQIISTVVIVGGGGFGIYAGLRDKIDGVKDAATKAKEASIQVQGDVKAINVKIESFTDTCKAHREAFDRRIARNESRLNDISNQAGGSRR